MGIFAAWRERSKRAEEQRGYDYGIRRIEQIGFEKTEAEYAACVWDHDEFDQGFLRAVRPRIYPRG